MYILVSDFFEIDYRYYLKLEIRVVCREFLAFKNLIFMKNTINKYLKLEFLALYVHIYSLICDLGISINTYSNFKMCVVLGEFLAFKYVFIDFIIQNLSLICISEIF